MSSEFPTRYDPTTESDRYARWETAGVFLPRAESRTGRHFSVVLPPPNVTGTLHVGHAVMLAIEDMMVRYHRMKGDRTVWVPGLDHAAIATQNVVEKKLKKENVQGRRTRHELGREAFLREVDVFVEHAKARIIEQTKAMGASLDWSRLAYTLDEQRSRAVREMFVRMEEAGILYRGNRIVNWCPRCKSTLADDEVEYKEETTPFYYFTYGPVVIGTARPETKFQDKTLVVHPEDERYKHLVGKTFPVEWIEDHPLTSNVIADPVIDPTFGTGAMTITPAHSFDDFDLAKKHGLPIVTIIDEDGNLTAAAGSFACRNAREARADIVAILQKKGLVDHIDENYTHNLSVCYRCATPVEPLPKLQWFVDVNKKFRPRSERRGGFYTLPRADIKSAPTSGDDDLLSLKDLALAVVGDGPDQIHILPERFTKEYFHWMENLRDWCISRQIWFGHQIPVWYHDTCEARDESGRSLYGKPAIVGELRADNRGLYWCTICKNGYDSVQHFTQDPDTLDTWFSSGMWTFSTLGWPEACVTPPLPPTPPSPPRGEGGNGGAGSAQCQKTGDLAAFHPTSVLETGYDILFFWVARMILMTEFALQEVPFRTVYLHGLVRDAKGRKMSKSLGNVIDPLDMVGKYGADAVRLALFIGTGPGQDSKLDEQKIAGYAKFTTKIWNIARYVSLTLGDAVIPSGSVIPPEAMTPADHWILAKRRALREEVTAAYEAFEFSRAAQATYDFAWHEFADWYIEATKVTAAPHQRTVLLDTLETILALLHPAMPFVTEALWERMRVHRGTTGDMSMLAATSWPAVDTLPPVDAAADTFAWGTELITAIRQLRNQASVPAATLVDVRVNAAPEDARALAVLRDPQLIAIAQRLARVREWSVHGEAAAKGAGAQEYTAAVRSVAVMIHPVS